MLFIISSGRGPVECERAVYKYFVYLKKEFETKEVKYKVLNEEETFGKEEYKSVTLDINSDFEVVKEYIGTILWINKSEHRKESKRKNWYIKADILDDNESFEFKLNEKDLMIQKMRSSGKGGQNVNKVETAVRIKHIPTGITVVSKEERTQYSNKRIGMRKIAEKLQEMSKKVNENKKTEVWDSKNGIERGNPDMVFMGSKFRRV